MSIVPIFFRNWWDDEWDRPLWSSRLLDQPSQPGLSAFFKNEQPGENSIQKKPALADLAEFCNATLEDCRSQLPRLARRAVAHGLSQIFQCYSRK